MDYFPFLDYLVASLRNIMRATKTNQEKLQNILKSQGFTIRYERGNFKGGHCIVMDEQMIIINKFYPLESKINTLADIVREVEIDPESLSEDLVKIVKKLKAGTQ